MSPWLASGLILAVLAAALGALHLYQRRCRPPAERVRKLFHLVAGAVGLALPWLFDSLRPVTLLAGAVLLGLLAIRQSKRLRDGVGSVIHGVGRRSLGDICFPLGIALLFALSGDDRLPFAITVLTLTLADPAAALVGLHYGRHRYRIAGADKSVEGSAAFFVVAFGCAAIPLVGAGGGLPSLAGAAALALTFTVVEALAPRGLDNLLIPIGGVVAVAAGLTGGPALPIAGRE